MGASLQPCPSCTRHIRAIESACPFCGAAMPEGFASLTRNVPQGVPLTRAAILFAGAAALVGCSSSSSVAPGGDSGPGTDSAYDGPVAAYGPAMVDATPDMGTPVDATPPDTGFDGPVAAYGPGPTPDAAFDGPMAAYGPAPVDGGNG